MKRSAILILLVWLAGCSDSTGPGSAVTGTWFGTMAGAGVQGITLSMTLVENAGVVTGNAQLGGTNVPKSLTATGTFSRPNLSVTITEGGLHPPANLTGTISGKTLTATITGSGFNRDAITMTRQ